MDHLTHEQKKEFIIEEFRKVSNGHEFIDPDKTGLLLGKLGFDVKDAQVSDLLQDATILTDGDIGLENIMSIVHQLLNKRREDVISVIDNDPDEVELMRNLKEFLKKMKQLAADQILLTDAMFKQMQEQFNVPDHLL